QQLLGPVLIAPYVAPKPPANDANGVPHPQPPDTGWYVVSPEQGSVNVALKATTRHRKIYNVPVYDADASIDAVFAPPPTNVNLPAGSTVNWQAARLVLGFSDLRGAKTDVTGVFLGADNKTPITFSPTTGVSLGSPGTPATAAPDAPAAKPSSSSYGLVEAPAAALVASKGGALHVTVRFTGAQRLSVMPFAKTTQVKVVGDWAAPSFDGGFLPDQPPKVDAKGFAAVWTVPFTARGLSDHGTTDALSLDQLGAKDLGVSLVTSNDPYQAVVRALKYAVMFVGLVFLTFFVFEALSGQRLHAAQYLLVGLAQMVFYLLLLSLSEYIGFDGAFAIAGVATVLLMGLYAGAAFRSRARGAQGLVVFSVVYGLIYLLMRLDDFALLAGSIASFLGLAGAMYLTRNLDWYGGKAAAKPPASQALAS
ncbi:MAG TPA: cell envelope integrity protein CreD, partial [Caulobacteraceae bacterium]|nr:cell envelope integrity protein CreD [Caulobacteraceae bacterium]